MPVIFRKITKVIDQSAFCLFLFCLFCFYFTKKGLSFPLSFILSVLISIGLCYGLHGLSTRHGNRASAVWKRNCAALSAMPPKEAVEILRYALQKKYALKSVDASNLEDDTGQKIRCVVLLHPEKVSPNEVYEIHLRQGETRCAVISLHGFSVEAIRYAKGLFPALACISAEQLPIPPLSYEEKQKKAYFALFSLLDPIRGFVLGVVLTGLFVTFDKPAYLVAGLLLSFLSLLRKRQEMRKPTLFEP